MDNQVYGLLIAYTVVIRAGLTLGSVLGDEIFGPSLSNNNKGKFAVIFYITNINV
jgi:hypothetical protein